MSRRNPNQDYGPFIAALSLVNKELRKQHGVQFEGSIHDDAVDTSLRRVRGGEYLGTSLFIKDGIGVVSHHTSEGEAFSVSFPAGSTTAREAAAVILAALEGLQKVVVR